MSDRSKEVEVLLNLVAYIRSETSRLDMEDAAYFADLLRTIISEQTDKQGADDKAE